MALGGGHHDARVLGADQDKVHYVGMTRRGDTASNSRCLQNPLAFHPNRMDFFSINYENPSTVMAAAKCDVHALEQKLDLLSRTRGELMKSVSRRGVVAGEALGMHHGNFELGITHGDIHPENVLVTND